MATNKQGKMAGYINYRMRVTLNDGRQMTGQMLAFDKHMNVVLADTEEFRRIKKQSKPAAPGSAPGAAQAVVQEEKRTLGLTIVRGAHIVSFQDLVSHDQLDEEPPLRFLLPVLLLVLEEVCRHHPSVVSQALPLDSLDVEALAHLQASLAPLVASHLLVSPVLQVVSSLLASLALLAAKLRLASTLLPDDNHDNTPRKKVYRSALHGA
ncbi:hypothetical protein J7T55_002055 [Diaporthe amygdali]|uniref:uncharacterized protein n=1 Tax=Phomopsis amygdali TaxID=1214568 RepID=UPI0022FE3A3B|nr:uncharacterized protein J7T55_002055 [Diaporthe amygdali]KAJ0108451.1 hypothetical protein J7T55_002055 [Diaporthe amygdali]